MSEAENCRYSRGDIENINLDYLNEKNILVMNTPGRNANAVADFTLEVMLFEMRNIALSPQTQGRPME